MHVLVVDDDDELVALVVLTLEGEGHRVTSAKSAALARQRLAERTFDVIVLEATLPDESGIVFCRSARRRGVVTPILILTADASVDQRVEGLDAGADDFLGKPFVVAELSARLRALGRRAGSFVSRTWTRGAVLLDFPKRRAIVNGVEVQLTTKEWNILDVLVAAAGRVVPRNTILQEVWGDTDGPSAASLDVLMTRIRKKLGADAVKTRRGEGYVLP